MAACAALAGASPTRTAGATVNGTVIHVGGKPFFPLMLIDQCTPGDTARARRLGINLVLNGNCPGVSPSQQLSMLAGRQLGVLDVAQPNVRGTRLVGWTYPDEPENNDWTAARLRSTFAVRRSSPDGLLSFITTGAGFFRAPYRAAHRPLSSYSQYARLADVAGFDLYPLGHCQQDLTAVYDAQRAFGALAGTTPTFQWIETGAIKPEYCGGFKMSPAELKAEVALAIAAGARGLGFFTHTWTPDHHAFDVTPAIEHALARITSLLHAVSPGLVGQTVPSSVDSGAIKLIARKGDGKTYVVAVNTHRSPIVAQTYVPSLADGSLQAFGEHRRLRVGNHRFVERFTPLAVHVYVQQE